jgi:hypothetical protein
MRFWIVVVLVAGLAPPAAAEDRAPAGASGKGGPGAAASSGSAKGGAKEPPQTSAAASPAAQDLARALVSKDDWERVLDHYATGLSGQVTASLSARGEKVPDGMQVRIRKELGDELPYAQVVEKQALALADRFTQDELKRAAAFYASPLGRKVVEALPEAQSALGHELQTKLATAVPKIVQRVAPRALASEAPGEGAAPGKAGPPSSKPGAREPQGTGSTTQR